MFDQKALAEGDGLVSRKTVTTAFPGRYHAGLKLETNLGRAIVLVAVGFHVPDDLMAEELRDLGGLKDEAFDVA